MKLEGVKNAVLIWGALSAEGITKLKQERKLVIVPEHRPFMLGLKYNCPRLRKAEIKFVYCTDNTLGLLFYKGKIVKTMLFYKEKQEQAIVGVAGSLYVALLSKLHKIPIEIIPAPELAQDIFEGDAAALGGRKFILVEDKQEYVVKPEDELIEWEVLR
jgi:methylthioribose-1-phosphate isomerase